MPLERNELETARFGVVAAHVTDPSADPTEIDAAADAMDAELLTARIDVGDLDVAHRLEEAGFRLMDTLVYYGRAVSDPPPAAPPPGTSIRTAEADDVAAVGSIARLAFHDYVGHFHADPRLDDADADAAYVQWAETSTAEAGPVRPVLLTCADDNVLGFLTLRDIGDTTAEIVLNAVDPEQQGRGIYAALVRAAIGLADRTGTERLVVSTQINNYGVQRVWARLGFVHERSIYTFHKWFDRAAPS
ncbi:MAG: GNAT family N-acetyltransferase [Actinomycetota bacterium]